jgi:molybdate transport system permease protein
MFPAFSSIDWSPLWLSLRVASIATVLSLSVGLAAGWALTRWQFRGKNLAEALVTAPIVLPPTVLGYYLLVLLGRSSPLG